MVAMGINLLPNMLPTLAFWGESVQHVLGHQVWRLLVWEI